MWDAKKGELEDAVRSVTQHSILPEEGSDQGSLRKSLVYIKTLKATKREEIEFFQRARRESLWP